MSSDGHGAQTPHRDELSEDRAEDLLHEAAMNIDRVRNDYPALTSEIDSTLKKSRTGIALSYLRVGREGQTPTPTELAEREVSHPWEDFLE